MIGDFSTAYVDSTTPGGCYWCYPRVSTIHFFDENRGMIAVSHWAKPDAQTAHQPRIYYTDNQGLSWSEAKTPMYDTTYIPVLVTDIYFRDSLIGWASTLQTHYDSTSYDTSAIWRTTDGGKTWYKFGNYASGNSVIETFHDSLVITSGGVAKADSLHVVATMSNNLYYLIRNVFPHWGIAYSSDGEFLGQKKIKDLFLS